MISYLNSRRGTILGLSVQTNTFTYGLNKRLPLASNGLWYKFEPPSTPILRSCYMFQVLVLLWYRVPQPRSQRPSSPPRFNELQRSLCGLRCKQRQLHRSAAFSDYKTSAWGTGCSENNEVWTAYLCVWPQRKDSGACAGCLASVYLDKNLSVSRGPELVLFISRSCQAKCHGATMRASHIV